MYWMHDIFSSLKYHVKTLNNTIWSFDNSHFTTNVYNLIITKIDKNNIII